MPEPPRHALLVWGLGLAVVVLLGARYLDRDGGSAPPARPAPQIRVTDASAGRVTVHVAGAVRRPGVYRLPAGERVADAVRRAGGAAPRADLSALNLAAKLEDGRQVVVPRRAAPGAPPGAAATPDAGPLDLNTATAEQLDELDGIGPATAETILKYREEHGGFGSVDELSQVPGIGEKRMATLREQVRV